MRIRRKVVDRVRNEYYFYKEYEYLRNKCGVYLLRSNIHNRVYIGGSCNILSRVLHHLRELREGIHKNKLMQSHFNEFNACFSVELLEACDKVELRLVEQKYLDQFVSFDILRGFNICKKSDSVMGIRHSEELKKAWSIKRKGRKLSQEVRQKIGHKGSKHSLSKFTEAQVLEIRNQHTGSRQDTLILSKTHNVSWHTIHLIIKRKTWTHI